jgi:heme exporter protein D
MDGFDLVLLIVVAYVAITSLVRLMLARRDRLIQDLHKQVEAQARGRKAGREDTHGNRAA